MYVTNIELLFLALVSAAISYGLFKKSNQQRRRFNEGVYDVITPLDVCLLFAGFCLMVMAIIFSFREFTDNGLTPATAFVGFKWAVFALFVKEAKSIHRALRPLLGGR